MSFQYRVAPLSLQHFAPSFEHRLHCARYARIIATQMTFSRKAAAILTDNHFLIPLVVFCIGLALLITLH
jgi:hypothetical protein